MNANEHEKKDFWIGKKAKIEIIKDNKRLIYTADIMEFNSANITFIDRDGNVFSFNSGLVQQMQLLNNGGQQ